VLDDLFDFGEHCLEWLIFAAVELCEAFDIFSDLGALGIEISTKCALHHPGTRVLQHGRELIETLDQIGRQARDLRHARASGYRWS
jgi:hypothetical protein